MKRRNFDPQLIKVLWQIHVALTINSVFLFVFLNSKISNIQVKGQIQADVHYIPVENQFTDADDTLEKLSATI